MGCQLGGGHLQAKQFHDENVSIWNACLELELLVQSSSPGTCHCLHFQSQKRSAGLGVTPRAVPPSAQSSPQAVVSDQEWTA